VCVHVKDGAVSHLSVLNKLMSMHEPGMEPSLSPELIQSVLTQMKQWRSDSDDVFLLDADIIPSTNPIMTFNVELATFMSEVVSRSSSVLSPEEWDFILCCLVAWFQTVNSASLSLLRTPCVMSFITALSRLLRCSAQCIQNVVPHQSDVYPSNLISEWKDVFSMSLFRTALSLYVTLASDVSRDSTMIMVRANYKNILHCVSKTRKL